MPTITSQRTSPTARRQRRRTRQRQKTLSIAFPHRQRNHRRSIPKRQLREQSADVDDCFEGCQELGYHLDPDIHVGSLARDENPFSVLDENTSTHSTPDPIPTPYQDHTIRAPNPFLAELEWHVAKNSYPTLEAIEGPSFNRIHERLEPVQHVPKFWRWPPSHIAGLEANQSSVTRTPPPTARPTIPPSVQTRSVPITPPPGANVKLPGTFPQDITAETTSRPFKRRRLNDSSPSWLTTAYRVPSPLLYHKPSGGALLNIEDEENSCICLGPSFEHTGQEYHSISGSESHDSLDHQPLTDLGSEATEPILQNQYRFVAAALPDMGTVTPYSPVEQAVLCSDPEFYTNTRPYLSSAKSAIKSKGATGNSTPTAGRTIKAKNVPSRICAAEDADTSLAGNGVLLPVVSIPEQSSTLQEARSGLRSHDLVFPQLSSPKVCRDKSLDRYLERTINLWSNRHNTDTKETIDRAVLNNDTVEYVQDRPNKFQELWDAYEKAVLGPKTQNSASANGPSVLSGPLRPFPDPCALPIVGIPGLNRGSTLFPAPVYYGPSASIDLKLPKEIENPAWSFSSCTALVPAKLYEIQYLGLTRRCDTDVPNLEQQPLPVSNVIPEQIKKSQSYGKIQQAVDWLVEDLELDRMFDDELEDEGAYLSWLQAGWDGGLFYPKSVASEVALPLSSPFEDVELGDEGQIEDSDSWSGTQVNEEAGEDMWWDWDDDVSGWSEPSADEFFEFDL